MPSTAVIALLQRRVESTPDAIAVRDSAGALTYAGLWERAGAVAAALVDAGTRPGEIVGLCHRRSADLVAGVVAIHRAAAACLPLDRAAPSERLRWMLDDARVRRVLVGGGDAVRLPAGAHELVPIEAAAAVGARARALPEHGPDDLAYLMYTSGTTGQPKGVMLPHRALANLIEWQLENAFVGPGDVTLQFSPISFDVSFQEIYATLCAGGTLACVDDVTRRDPVLLWAHLAREGVARLFLPFVSLQSLALVADTVDLDEIRLRDVVTAGERLRCGHHLKEMFLRLPGCRLTNQYGPTETHAVTSYTLDPDPRAWPLLPPIGAPISNVRCSVTDTDGVPVRRGEVGELRVAGEAVALGYWRRPDLTAERFAPDPVMPGRLEYRTGDFVALGPDGLLAFHGRRDTQVKVSGHRVELGEVEAALAEHPAVREVTVGVRDEPGGVRSLVAFVSPRAGHDTGDLRGWLAERLPAYLVPARIVVVDAVARTASGKADARRLVAEHFPEHAAPEPASDPAEELARIITSELGLPSLDAYQGFVAHGGDSLAAVEVMARMAGRTGLVIPVERILAGAGVDELLAAASPVAVRAAGDPVGPVRVSAAQREYLVAAALAPTAPPHVVAAELVVSGPLDEEAVREALRRVVARHSALRTRFGRDGREFWQEVVRPPGRVPVTSAGRVTDPTALRRRVLTTAVDLGEPVLPRLTMYQAAGESSRRLLFLAHHATCDGWSLNQILDELVAEYAASMHGAARPPDRAPQFWAACAAERAPAPDRVAAVSDAFADLAARPPREWGRPRTNAPELARRTGSWPRAEVDATAAAAGVTPFAVMLGAWAHALPGPIAVAVSGRVTSEDFATVGAFARTVVVRANADLSLPGLAAELATAQGFADVPLGSVARGRRADRFAQPLAQVLVALQPEARQRWTLPDTEWTVEWDLGVPERAGRYDVLVNVFADAARYTLTVDYRCDVLDDATVDGLIAAATGFVIAPRGRGPRT